MSAKEWEQGARDLDALLVWASLALAAEARLCRARAVLAATFAELIDEEARR